MPADGSFALAEPSALPLLRDLTAAEDTLEAELERLLSTWERAKAVPKDAEQQVARFMSARLLAMTSRAIDHLYVSLRQFAGKDANSFQADRVTWARTRGAELARGITAESRERIASIVASAAQTGAGPSTIRREIEGLVPGIAGRSPKQRASVIARTELHNAAMYAQEKEALRLNERGAKLVKVWTATRDNRTRPTHRAANGQVRRLNEPFIVGGSAMMRPGDGPAKEVVNCRCVARYMPESYVDQDRELREAAARLEAPAKLNRDEGDPKDAPRRFEATPELLQTMRADHVAANAKAAPPPVIEDPVKAFAAARRWVLSHGKAVDREFLTAYDWKTGVTHIARGTKDSVTLPAAVRNGTTGRSVTILHNHPTNTAHDVPLSSPDIKIAMRAKVESVTALGNKGSIFTAYAKEGFNHYLIKRLEDDAYSAAWRLTPKTWPEDDRLAIVHEAMNQALAKYGVIDYVTSLTGATRRFFETEAELMAKVQAKFEGVLEKANLTAMDVKAADRAVTTIYEAPRGLSDQALQARVRELRALKAKGEPGVDHALRVGELMLEDRGLKA